MSSLAGGAGVGDATADWQLEFRRWAPDLNVVMYIGDRDSREIIREKEFYSEPAGNQRRPLKFNVLLTTYEMVLKDRDELGYRVAWRPGRPGAVLAERVRADAGGATNVRSGVGRDRPTA